MDASISTLVNCEYEQTYCYFIFLEFLLSRKLSLSTNMIEKIANLNGLSKIDNLLNIEKSNLFLIENLKILSLGRNLIKNLVGLVSQCNFN